MANGGSECGHSRGEIPILAAEVCSGRWGLRAAAARVISAVLAACLLVSVLVQPAAALTRGEIESYPGGFALSNFILPDGRRVYCVERSIGIPFSVVSAAGPSRFLPGREGLFHAFTSPEGMRQINYLIDQHGQTGNPARAAAVQLAVWKIRARAGGSAPLESTIGTLRTSEKGRRLLAETDGLIERARGEARAPSPGRPIERPLVLARSGTQGGTERESYFVSYPEGASRLEVSGGAFAASGSSVALAEPGAAGRLEIVPTPGASELRVQGEWESPGTPGWEGSLSLFSTQTSGGATGQRVVAATGRSAGAPARGVFDAVSETLPPPAAPPSARTEAQSTAQLGSTMVDELILEPRAGTRPRIWPGASAEFRAYLYPEPGQPKYDRDWQPLREPRAEGAQDEGSALTWTATELETMTEEERCRAQPVSEQRGIPVAGVGRVPSRPVRVRSVGQVHWVERILSGDRVAHEGKCGLSEETTVIQRPKLSTIALKYVSVGETAWDTAQISGVVPSESHYSVMFEAFRYAPSAAGHATGGEEVGSCDAEHRIYASDPITVTGPGTVEAPGFTVRLADTTRIAWVASLVLEDESGRHVVDRGRCGQWAEMTEVSRPEVATAATPEASAGDPIQDRARLTGNFSSNAEAQWEISFEGFRGPDPAAGQVDAAGSGDQGSGSAIGDDRGGGARTTRASGTVCTRANRVISTRPIPVAGPGTVNSPEIFAQPGVSGEVWWVETLTIVERGVRTPVLRGECGATNERTRVTVPRLETQADPIATVGGVMRDVATVTGALPRAKGRAVELEFRGYRATTPGVDGAPAVCDGSTEVFRTEMVQVTAAGAYQSPEVFVSPGFGDAINWVARLTVRDGDGPRIAIARGRCGERAETTVIQRPAVRTEASGTTSVGGLVSDLAHVTGLPPRRDGVEFLVRFTAYSRGRDERLTCTPEHRIPELSDETGTPVVGGEARSAERTAEARHVGDGGFVATLVLLSGGKEWPLAEGDCGEASEAFAIRSRAVRLPDAGSPGSGHTPMLFAAAVLSLCGGVLVVSGGRRRWGPRGAGERK